VARSVSPIGRNINNCSKSARSALLMNIREAHRLNKERFAGIYREPLRGSLNRPPQPSLRVWPGDIGNSCSQTWVTPGIGCSMWRFISSGVERGETEHVF